MTEQASARFDLGRSNYDRRAGIPSAQCEAIAQAVVRLAGAGPDDLLLELGAGTGLIGAWFPATGVRYIGLDASEPMLEVFRERLDASHGPASELHRCDVNQRWPVADRSVACIFSSRAVHHFDLGHLADESARVAAPSGASFVLGRVHRDPGSPRERLRHEKRTRLADRGYSTTDGRGRHRRALEALAGGGEPLDRVVAATWSVRYSSAEVLRDWTELAGLAGSELTPSVKAEIIAELEGWAESEFGPLEGLHESEERYVLEGMRLPGA
jgi:methyltransferase family protein